MDNLDDQNHFLNLENIDELGSECQILVKDAENDKEKQFLVAKNYIEGEGGFPQNVNKGIQYYATASSLNNSDAQFRLGYLY